MPEKPVISNTSPLVGLWTLNLFPLLRELYTEVLIPEEVRAEFFATESETRTAKRVTGERNTSEPITYQRCVTTSRRN